MTKLEKFQAAFTKAYPKAWSRIGDFYGDGSTVFWAGEDSFTNNGLPLFDYYSETGEDVLPELAELAKKHGFYFECYDPGTYIATEM